MKEHVIVIAYVASSIAPLPTSRAVEALEEALRTAGYEQPLGGATWRRDGLDLQVTVERGP